MNKRYVNAFLLIFVILVIAFSSLYFGQKMMHKHQGYHGHYNAHQYLHDQLNITEEQERELSKLEAKYQKQKKYLEEVMRLANMELANNIGEDRSYSENVQKSVDKIHKAMGGLQKLTLEHLFEMQNILDDEQDEKLIELITNSLYDDTRKRD